MLDTPETEMVPTLISDERKILKNSDTFLTGNSNFESDRPTLTKGPFIKLNQPLRLPGVPSLCAKKDKMEQNGTGVQSNLGCKESN